MKEVIHFVIPIVPGSGSTSQERKIPIQKTIQHVPNLLDGNTMKDSRIFHVDVVFYMPKRKDIDNMLKVLFDSMKGRVIPDDEQILSLTARQEIGYDKLGTHVILKEF